MFEGGMVQNYANMQLQLMNYKRYEHLYQLGPQRLTMTQLEPGFSIWLLSVAVALLSFALEILARFVESYFIKSVISSFYQLRVEEMRPSPTKTKTLSTLL